MNYYEPMVRPHYFRIAALITGLAELVSPGWAQPAPEPAAKQTPRAFAVNPALDGELFYEMFLGELNARTGDAGTGYALMLDAARRSGDSQLYRRSIEIALQARSGDYALAAARAWKEADPASREANRYVLQLLIALNRISETTELLRRELALSSELAKLSTLGAIPQIYGRASDKTLAATIVEQSLADELTNPHTGSAAWIALGRMRLAAGNKMGALEATRHAVALDPTQEDSAALAVALIEEGIPDAESIVRKYLAQQSKPDLRWAYARVLIGQQRFAEAIHALEIITAEKPDFSEAWLSLSKLQLQGNQTAAATRSNQRALELIQAMPANERPKRLLTEAYLLNASIAERNKDYSEAANWLGQIDDSEETFSIQRMRATLLARQGELTKARSLLRQLPASTPDTVHRKLQAEVQLLQDLHRYQEAYDVQTELVALAPDEVDFAYQQAMLAEKAGQTETMEKLLRQLILRHPDYFHAYNALGYSLAERGERLDEAKQLINKALQHAPEDPFITDSLGWVEFRLGNRGEAARLLTKAFQVRPDPEIAAHLGEVLWSMGERERATTTWQEGLRLSPDNGTLKDTLKRLGVPF
ncbi:MAG: tetratricopeptide repeat protein [Burkholderiaceae bacterium]|nr:tetratricopeptide repeat protein [Burkholderiaceae bacterium]